MKLLIKNGTMVDASSDKPIKKDILIENGVIAGISDVIRSDCETIDASGLYVCPGFVDMHAHLREPGFEEKETILTGCRAAAAGGFTSIGVMANTAPVVDSVALFEYVDSSARNQGVKVYQYSAVTKGMQGKELVEMTKLKEAGVIALSDDGKPVENPQIMLLALKYAQPLDLLIISHCEDMALANGGVMNEGYYASIQGLRGISAAAEEVMVARDIILADSLGARVHIAHVSTKGSVDIIRDAKKRGSKLTCETAPHYFSMTEERCDHFNTYAKVNPPLRTAADREAIIDGLKDGTIDCIATDHAPHTKNDKEREFDLAANGFSGFETAFSLAVTHLYNTKAFTLPQIVRLMSANPAKCLGISGGKIAIGENADLTVVSLDEEWTVEPEKFLSKGRNTPLKGEKLAGRVKYTVADGTLIYK